jgi:hypothetical protein
LFVNWVFISKHLLGFVCHEIFGNFFRHSEIFGLHPPPPPPPPHPPPPPPPPPQLYMLATAVLAIGATKPIAFPRSQLISVLLYSI